jgi:hypothetical protein
MRRTAFHSVPAVLALPQNQVIVFERNRCRLCRADEVAFDRVAACAGTPGAQSTGSLRVLQLPFGFEPMLLVTARLLPL